MKKLLIPFVAFIVVACTQTKAPVENPAEKYAIDSIEFFTQEQSFDSIKRIFEDKVSNPEWKGDNMAYTYPFIYKGWGFDKTTGLFSKDGLLIGVMLSNIENRNKVWESIQQLDSLTAMEFGKPTDAHQSPSTNDVKAKGEYAYKFFQNGNKCALFTFSWSNDLLHENLYIYRADQIPQSETGRRIDNDMVELNKLK